VVDRKTKGCLRNKILGRPFLITAKGVNDVSLFKNYVTLSKNAGSTFSPMKTHINIKKK